MYVTKICAKYAPILDCAPPPNLAVSFYFELRRDMNNVSIVIADRHPVFLCGLISILRWENTFNIVAVCRDDTKSIQVIRDLCPEIALLDISMLSLSRLRAVGDGAWEGLRTRIVLIAADEERRSPIAAVMRAYGVLPRDVQPEILIHELRQVAAGRRLSSYALPQGVARRGTRRSVHKCNTGDVLTILTEREREIMNLVSEGLPNKEVGRRLNLSAGTIKVHLHNMFQKLAINNRTALTALAVFNHSADGDAASKIGSTNMDATTYVKGRNSFDHI